MGSGRYFFESAEKVKAMQTAGDADAKMCYQLDEEFVPPQFIKEAVVGLICSICCMPQINTPSGVCCENGHGGAEGLEDTLVWWHHPESESYFQERLSVMGPKMKSDIDAAHCNEVDESEVPPQFIKEKQMTEQVAAPVLPIDKLVQIYIKIRDKKAEIKKAFDAEYAKLDEKLSMVATELKSRAQAEGVDGFKSESGTVYLSETMKVSGSDWGAFGQFLKTHDPLEFMEKRISATAIKAYMKETDGQLPPGVSIFKEVEARVRRAGEK